MKKIVTSMGFFNDAIGKRISITYTEIDDEGRVVSDNKRIDRVITDSVAIEHVTALERFAQTFVDSIE